MTFYSEIIDKAHVIELSTNIGRACHAMRNFTQGAVSLEHPEILSLDNIAGQLEGQARAIRSHLLVEWEIKHLIKNVFRSSHFLKKIFAGEFFNDNFFSSDVTKMIRDCIEVVITNIRKIDREVNIAILKQSSDIFIESMPAIPEISDTRVLNAEFAKWFSPDAAQLATTAAAKSDINAFCTDSIKIWSLISNKAHSVQDVVSDYLNKQPCCDQANEIVNQAGNVENSARAAICEFVGNRDRINGNAIKDHTNNIRNIITTIRDLIGKDDFMLKDKKEYLLLPNLSSHKILINTSLIQ